MIGALLTRGIEIHGENITDEQLFAWLGIGADKYGNSRRDKEQLETISRWLENHPERYKAIWALCSKQCEGAKDVRNCIFTHEHRLHGAAVPEDIGLWDLEQASKTADEDNARKLQHAEKRRTRSITVSKQLPAIGSGTANAGQMHELASVWMKHYSDIYGETPLERFDNYCENGSEVLAAAEAGFLLCPERHDLPSAAELIDLSTKQRQHLICKPCLLGMELRWRQGVSTIDVLGDDALRRMLAFQLTSGNDTTPEWFTHFVRERPALLAEVLVDYARATLKAGKDIVS